MCQKKELTDAASRQEHLGRQATIHTCVKEEFWEGCPHEAVSACGTLKHCRSTASPFSVPCVLGLSLLETNAVAPKSMESCRRAVGGVRKGNSDTRDWNRQDETEKLCLECLELFNRFGPDVGNRPLASVRMIPPCLRNSRIWICLGRRSEREVGCGSHQHAAYGPTLSRGHEDSGRRVVQWSDGCSFIEIGVRL